MPSQLTMFAVDSTWPEGLRYQPDFINAPEEDTLIDHIRALPLAPFQFGVYEGKRRVVYFGSRYDFTHQLLSILGKYGWIVRKTSTLIVMYLT